MSNKITFFLKEQCDIDDEDEVQKITSARNHMKKNKAVIKDLQ